MFLNYRTIRGNGFQCDEAWLDMDILKVAPYDGRVPSFDGLNARECPGGGSRDVSAQ